MKPSDVKRLEKQATYKRPDGDAGIVLTNGHWLLRIPTAYWPTDLATDAAVREGRDHKGAWDRTAEPPDMDAIKRVMPQPFGSNGTAALERAEFAGRPVAEIEDWNHGVPRPLAPYKLGDEIVAFQRQYVDMLARLGVEIHAAQDQKPATAFPLVWGASCVGALMPVALKD